MNGLLVISVLLRFAVAYEHIDWDQVPPRHVDDQIDAHPKGVPVGGRITNGAIAEPKQFPHQVGLLLNLKDGKSWCGGTLISDQWIVSAAHCADGVESAHAFLGATNRTDRTEVGQKIVQIEKNNIFVHEGWNPDNLLNDISLLKLPNAIELNDYMKPAKLPPMGDTSSYEGMKAIASGWGRESDSAKGASQILRWVEVPIMKNNVCGRYYLGAVKGSHICIDTRGRKSTCNGDSGGPLILADGSNTLIGATSFGIVFGCEVQFPGVFTRITSYLDWINNKMAESN